MYYIRMVYNQNIDFYTLYGERFIPWAVLFAFMKNGYDTLRMFSEQ